MADRAHQYLIKLALELEWEAQDTKEAIFNAIRFQPKFVLDADIAGCFDNISHTALLQKLHSYPAIRRTIKAWLKAGILEDGGFQETIKGTPQGGVVSPLLVKVVVRNSGTNSSFDVTILAGQFLMTSTISRPLYRIYVLSFDSIHQILLISRRVNTYTLYNIYTDIERGLIMIEAALSPISSWQNFYVILGTSAGALTGLMFVVITLIANRNMGQQSRLSVDAFGSPIVVHFCMALLIAAILSAPWEALWNVSLLIGLTGLGGVVYLFIVVLRTRRQSHYQPVVEDWVWYQIFPFIFYLALLVSGILLSSNPVPALYVIGGATILLLFTGIRNAWDTVTYIAIDLTQSE